METWKDIPGYEGLYQVSDFGRVKSLNYLRTGTSQLLKPGKNDTGRLIVALYNNGVVKNYQVHILVALAFIGERPKGYDVCHSNGKHQDNRLVNLSYDTKTQNCIDMYRYGGKSPSGKLSLLEVLFIRRLYETNNYSYRKLGKMFGINNTAVGFIIRRVSFSWLNDDGTIDESKTAVSVS